MFSSKTKTALHDSWFSVQIKVLLAKTLSKLTPKFDPLWKTPLTLYCIYPPHLIATLLRVFSCYGLRRTLFLTTQTENCVEDQTGGAVYLNQEQNIKMLNGMIPKRGEPLISYQI